MNEFDDLTDLDDVLGPLRSGAQPAELAGESATVDLMVKAHRIPEEKHMFRSRPARIATLIAAGVLGFGGMAAAASPSAEEFLTAALEETEESPELTVESTEETEETEELSEETEESPELSEELSEETEESPELTEELPEETEESPELTEELPEEPGDAAMPDLDDETTEFNENYCEEGNHGKTVSAVARGLFDPNDEYPGDVTVVMAAQSSCGKLGEIDGDPEPEEPAIEESEVDDVEEPEVEAPEKADDKAEKKAEKKAERPGKGADGQGNGKSNGNGKRGG